MNAHAIGPGLVSAKPKPRFTTEEQILTAIDKNQQKATNNLQYAEECEQEVESWKKFIAENENAINRTIKEEVNRARAKIEPLKRQARKYRRRATTLLDEKAKKLKNQLATFRTELMPFETERSIPA
jgi:molecular chaperone DnaK (HSP70)